MSFISLELCRDKERAPRSQFLNFPLPEHSVLFVSGKGREREREKKKEAGDGGGEVGEGGVFL